MAENLATYGVKLTADTAAAEQWNRAQASMAAATEASARKIDLHSAAMSRNVQSALTMARGLGPLESSSTRVGIALERMAARAEMFTERANRSAAAQNALTTAFKAGLIASATLEGAIGRVNAAKSASVQASSALGLAEGKLAELQGARAEVMNVMAAAQAVVNNGINRSGQEHMKASEALRNYSLAQQTVKDGATKLAQIDQLESAVRKEKAVAVGAETVAKKELAEADKLLSVAQAGVGMSTLALGAVIAGVIVTLAAFVATVGALVIAWKEFRGAIEAGAAKQKIEFPFKQLIGNATLAEEKLKELHDFTSSQGSFNFEQLTKAAEQLTLLGTGADNLIPRVQAVATLAAASGQSIDGMTQAYARAQQAIMNSTELMTRGVNDSVVLVQALMAEFGKSKDQIQEMFKKGQISIEQVNKAIQDATKSGGVFGKTLQDYMQNTLPGATMHLKNVWEELQSAFGKPIATALAPLLNDLAKWLETLVPLAKSAGEEVAHILRALELIAKEQSWQTTIKAAWELVLIQMGIMIFDILLPKIETFGLEMGKSILRSVHSVLTGENDPGNKYLSNLIEGWKVRGDELSRIIADALKRAELTATQRGVGLVSDLSQGSYGDQALHRIPKATKDSATQVKTDSDIIADYQNQMSQIANIKDATERYRRSLELTESTYKELYDPKQLTVATTATNGLTDAQRKAMEIAAERLRLEKEVDQAIINGTATATQAVIRGLEKARQAFGTWQQGLEKATTEIVNALDNDISSSLSDILDGTKSVSQGFKDMALSIVKDIEKIIVKLLVQWAIQQALGYFSGGGSVTGSVNSVGNSVVGAGGSGKIGGGLAEGGPISGGSGSRDDVPIMVMGGEYVIRKDAARSIGLDNLNALNAGRAHVRGYATGGEVNPPWHGDVDGNLADYGFYQSNLNTHFSGGVTPTSATTYVGAYRGTGGNFPRMSDIQQAIDAGRSPSGVGAGLDAGASLNFTGFGGVTAGVTLPSGSPSYNIGVSGQVHVGDIQPNTALGVYQVWDGTQWQSVARIDASATLVEQSAARVLAGATHNVGSNVASGGVTGGVGGHSPDYIGYGTSQMSASDARIKASTDYGGAPNLPQADERNLFRSGRWQLDEGGGYSQVGLTSGSVQNHPLSNNPASIAAYNQWAMSLAPHFHGGGIIGMANGGQVGERLVTARDGEGVFTPAQMAALSPSKGGGNIGSVSNTVTINLHTDGSGKTNRSESGNSDEVWQESVKQIEAICVATIIKQQRFGGAIKRGS